MLALFVVQLNVILMFGHGKHVQMMLSAAHAGQDLCSARTNSWDFLMTIIALPLTLESP
jgi:hypothetical protein